MRKIAIELAVVIGVFLIGCLVGATAVTQKQYELQTQVNEIKNKTDSVFRATVLQSDSIQLLKADSLRALIRASRHGN